MRRARNSRGAAGFGCVVWILILALIGYCLVQILPVKIASSQFEDFMQEEAGFGSVKNLTQLEKEILAKARELKIPLTKENLSVKRGREAITIEAHYELTVDFFGGLYKYVWKFNPVVSRPTFAV
jgi:hypothetical protein